MTREEIIALAREAGLYVGTNLSGIQLVGSEYRNRGLLVHLTVEELERFAALIAQREREECAKVCEAEASIEGIAQRCAVAIRARGNPDAAHPVYVMGHYAGVGRVLPPVSLPPDAFKKSGYVGNGKEDGPKIDAAIRARGQA